MLKARSGTDLGVPKSKPEHRALSWSDPKPGPMRAYRTLSPLIIRACYHYTMLR